MTTTTTPPAPSAVPAPPAPRLRAAVRWLAHYLEMVVAMLLGMALLHPLQRALWPGLGARPALDVLVMATDMTVAMVLWMRVRGSTWRSTAAMSAAMYAPFLVLLVPYGAGLISAGTLSTGGHLLMFPAMALAMWPRQGASHH